MSFSAEKSRTRLKHPPQEEQRITNATVALAEEQLAAVRRQSELAQYLFDNAPEYFDEVAKSGALDEDDFVNRIDQIRANIGTASENALRLGEADINRNTQLGLEGLRDTLAPDRGLRPGDSPILGLGSDIVREGMFQQGQLVRSIRGQEASQLADFDQAATQFQADLKQNAFANRLALAGGATELGIGLNPNFNVPAALAIIQQPRLASAKTRGKAGQFSSGEAGQLMEGIGSIAGMCWVAAEYYGWGTPEWWHARNWIAERWRGPVAWAFRRVYGRHGPRVAGWVRRSRLVRATLRPLFAWAERKGR